MEADKQAVRNFLSGNYQGRANDGYVIRKTFERLIERMVITETFDMAKAINATWEFIIEPEFARVRINDSDFVQDFIPSGMEWWIRDEIKEQILEITGEENVI